MPKLSWLLTKSFFHRINKKYGGVNFHPLFLFYYLGMLLLPVGGLLGLYTLSYRIAYGGYTVGTVVLVALLLLLGAQFLMFALLFDEMSNSQSYAHPGATRKPTVRGLLRRFTKYWGVDFHPIGLFYIGGFVMGGAGGVLALYILWLRITLGSEFTYGTLLLTVLLLVLGFQSLLFARVFELESYGGRGG